VIFWWVVFAGTHTVLSHPPIRSALIARLGAPMFQVGYSIIALATFVPLVWTFFAGRTGAGIPLQDLVATPGIRWLSMLLMLVAFELVVLAFARPNPVSMAGRPDSDAAGILRVTRHPLFMGLALFGLAHLLVRQAPLDLAFFGGMLVYSLLGAAHQDLRKRSEGPTMQRFYQETSLLPFAAIATGRTRFEPREIGPAPLAIGLVLFAIVFVFHHRWFA
jgi:uncharacterized membrane protein